MDYEITDILVNWIFFNEHAILNFSLLPKTAVEIWPNRHNNDIIRDWLISNISCFFKTLLMNIYYNISFIDHLMKNSPH